MMPECSIRSGVDTGDLLSELGEGDVGLVLYARGALVGQGRVGPDSLGSGAV